MVPCPWVCIENILLWTCVGYLRYWLCLCRIISRDAHFPWIKWAQLSRHHFQNSGYSIKESVAWRIRISSQTQFHVYLTQEDPFEVHIWRVVNRMLRNDGCNVLNQPLIKTPGFWTSKRAIFQKFHFQKSKNHSRESLIRILTHSKWFKNVK
jgi:hypothetical protein